MLWHKSQGAGGTGGAGEALVGYATASDTNDIKVLQFSLAGLDIQSGDLAVVATCSDIGDPFLNVTGFTLVQADIGVNQALHYRVLDGTETLISCLSGGGAEDVTGMVAVFRGYSFRSANVVAGSSGMPDPPPISVAAGEIVLAIGHLDDDPVSTVDAQANYTMIGSVAVGSSEKASTTMMSYRAIDTTGPEDPLPFVGAGDDANSSISIALQPN